MEILPPTWKFPPGRHGPVRALAELRYKPGPDEFLLISGQHHAEIQLITHEGGPGVSRMFIGCRWGHPK